jgi:hypothetical protein
MYSKPLLARLNGFDFLLLKGQSHDNVCVLCKTLWWNTVRRKSLWQHFANKRNRFYIV